MHASCPADASEGWGRRGRLGRVGVDATAAGGAPAKRLFGPCPRFSVSRGCRRACELWPRWAAGSLRALPGMRPPPLPPTACLPAFPPRAPLPAQTATRGGAGSACPPAEPLRSAGAWVAAGEAAARGEGRQHPNNGKTSKAQRPTAGRGGECVVVALQCVALRCKSTARFSSPTLSGAGGERKGRQALPGAGAHRLPFFLSACVAALCHPKRRSHAARLQQGRGQTRTLGKRAARDERRKHPHMGKQAGQQRPAARRGGESVVAGGARKVCRAHYTRARSPVPGTGVWQVTRENEAKTLPASTPPQPPGIEHRCISF
jgi:hypothetical protein